LYGLENFYRKFVNIMILKGETLGAQFFWRNTESSKPTLYYAGEVWTTKFGIITRLVRARF